MSGQNSWAMMGDVCRDDHAHWNTWKTRLAGPQDFDYDKPGRVSRACVLCGVLRAIESCWKS
jgi:hypothetical protein